MRAIIIDDADARALLDSLKLERLEDRHPFIAEVGRNLTDEERAVLRHMVNDVHRRFHYVVTRWLQDQGASLTR